MLNLQASPIEMAARYGEDTSIRDRGEWPFIPIQEPGG
jgi:hypothetical protein